ncbi:MAG: phosphatidylglycerophosphatase A [Gammaproteobacteria bacterium]|nr:phosphatidylglycerophosphatase A [Gammaproteobacteria bacterium]
MAKAQNPSIKECMTNPIHALAFGLGSGLAPFAPGTFGTLVAIPLYLVLQPLSLSVYMALLLLLILVSIYICGESAKQLKTHDHSGIVLDEICGYLVTMILVPNGWLWIVLGFLLFRLFDIWKPWPINWLDRRVQGGLGIVIDDVLAGVFAAICLQLAILLMGPRLL